MDTTNQPSQTPEPPISQPTPMPATPPPTPIPPKSKMPLMIIAAIILLGLGSLGVYYFANNNKQPLVPNDDLIAQVSPTITPPSPTPDPTADWKTYTNTKYNYSVQYPASSDLIFLDCSHSINPRSKDRFILVQKENSGCEGQTEGWIIFSEGDQSCNSTESWKSVSTVVTVNNIKASKCVSTFTGTQLNPGPTEIINVVFTDKEGTPVNFTLNDSKYSQLFDQILTTFKFTN